MTIKNRKLIDIALALGLTASIILSMSGFSASCRDMYENIIRIRIIANSDSEEDQNLKLKVRDAVLENTKLLFEDADSYSEAVTIAQNNLEFIRLVAEKEIRAEGFDYSVSLALKDEYFDTREYDNFTLPAGVYETLVFTIGEGEGQNWWCVLFPPLCLSAASESVENEEAFIAVGLNSDQYKIITETDDTTYYLRFKLLEALQGIK